MAEQRYRVIDRLEAGGMAEVFRGEALSVQGFKKQVAIKRVLPHLAQNKSFIRMFLDEARLGARLNHANIVTVFDIGAADNTYFIVMEFVDGANLKTILETLKKLERKPSVKEVLYIGMEICKGLSHAHALTDDAGRPLNIVHRDISPPNILITRGGEVKVTDFGLAKATTQLEKTDPGVVKGKFSYLSPEAALGQEVDARADIFAVGILMWEALAGQRLFLGESDYDTVKKVQGAEVPSLASFHEGVDPELDVLLSRAMARERDARFQSAQELGDEIADYLFRHRLKVTSFDIARMMQGVVSAREERKKRADSSVIDRLIEDELLAFTSLDEMSDPLNPAAASQKGQAARKASVQLGSSPLDADSFTPQGEDPSTWYADDEVEQATRFYDRANYDIKPSQPSTPRSDPRELANWLENDETGKGRVPPARALEPRADHEPEESDPPGPRAVQLEGRHPEPGGQVRPGTAAKSTTDSARPVGIYVALAVLVLTGLGTAAWLGFAQR